GRSGHQYLAPVQTGCRRSMFAQNQHIAAMARHARLPCRGVTFVAADNPQADQHQYDADGDGNAAALHVAAPSAAPVSSGCVSTAVKRPRSSRATRALAHAWSWVKKSRTSRANLSSRNVFFSSTSFSG